MARFVTDWHNKPNVFLTRGRTFKLRSLTERRWAEYLEFQWKIGAITEYLYEPEIFWFGGIKRGTTNYLPDFQVFDTDGTHYWQEVKVRLVKKDITKFKRMALFHPNERLILVMDRPKKKEGQRELLAQAAKYVKRIVYMNQVIK